MTPLLFSLCNIGLIAALSSIAPRYTRPDVFFAVTVHTTFRNSAEGRRILSSYLVLGWIATAVLAMATATAGNEFAPRFAVAGPLVIWLAAFLDARRRVLPHAVAPTTVRSALLVPRRDRIPGGAIAVALPFIFLALKGVEYYLRWDQIPDRFPVHWGISGPDRWVNREPLTVFGSLAGIVVACAVMLWIAWGIVHASRQVAITGDNSEAERRFRRIGVIGTMSVAYAFAATLPVIPNMYLTAPYPPVLILAACIIMVFGLAKSGQGGSRLPDYRPILSGEAPAGDGTFDNHWKLGMFYINRSDPSLIVEKRFGVGWTLNFGHPVSWVMMAVLLAWPLVGIVSQR